MRPILIAIILIFGITKPNDEISVDLIELNHISNDSATFDQIIFWKEYPSQGLCRSELRAIGFQVIGTNDPLPLIYKKNGYYKVQHKYQNDHGYSITTVVSKFYRESWSRTDPERESARKHWGGEPPNIFNRITIQEEYE